MRRGLNHFSAPPFRWHLICWFILFPPHRHYSTPLFTAPVISPPPPLLHPNYRCIVCVLPPHARRPTYVFAPPANPAHTRDRRACAACHLWATWSHRLPSLYVHMRKMSAISEADNNLCRYFKTQVPLAAGGGGGGDDEGCWCHWCCLATNVCFQLAGFGCLTSEWWWMDLQ